MERILLKCNYCKHTWLSNKNPKKCPTCHNPVGEFPKNNQYSEKIEKNPQLALKALDGKA